MAEYIERKALLADLRGSYDDLMQIYNGLQYDEERRICSGELVTFMECIMRVKDAPTADVVEVRHGKVVVLDHDEWWSCVYKCCDCGGEWMLEPNKPAICCPYCEVRLDGKGEG